MTPHFDLEPLLREFASESAEGLDAAEQGLMALEARPDDRESLAVVFRTVHTLKGNALSLGFAAVSELAHGMEDLLDALRGGRVPVNGGAVTALLESVDAARELLAAGAAAPVPAPVRALIDRLTRAAADGTDAGSSTAPAFAGGVAAEGRRTVRVSLEMLDRLLDLTGEIAIARGRLGQLVEGRAGHQEVLDAYREAERLGQDLQEAVMKARLVPLGPVLRQQARTVRDLAAAQGKQACLVTEGEDVQVDASVVEHVRDPLTHMVRNALDHGIEVPARRAARGKPACGRVVLRACQSESSIILEVEDDGAGLDRRRISARRRQLGLPPEDAGDPDAALQVVFEPGFSTAEQVTDISGRGVGLDVVRGAVEALHGSVSVRSREGQGAVFTMRLPLTLAIMSGFAVHAGGETFILPMDAVVECIDAGPPAAGGEGLLMLRDAALPVFDLGEALHAAGPRSARPQVVVVRRRGGVMGLKVDAIEGECLAVVKPLAAALGALPSLLGATILGNGRVALILDPGALRAAAGMAGQVAARPLTAERRTS